MRVNFIMKKALESALVLQIIRDIMAPRLNKQFRRDFVNRYTGRLMKNENKSFARYVYPFVDAGFNRLL